MNVMTLKHAGLVLYQRPKSNSKWHLPVCSELMEKQLTQSNRRNPMNWELVDMDGCPTYCYVMTTRLVRALNKQPKFTSFFGMLVCTMGEGPVKLFFHDLWVKNHNIKAAARNRWEKCHGILPERNNYRSMSLRDAAKMSL